MQPVQRAKILDSKGFCRQCLTAGAKKGHDGCKKQYMCKHPSHDPSSEGYHVLVCSQHNYTRKNDILLKKFRENYIQTFDDLPLCSQDIMIAA